jgi:Histone methylation protein DOT1
MNVPPFSPQARARWLQECRAQPELWEPRQFAVRSKAVEQIESLWGFDLNPEEVAFLQEMEALDQALCDGWVAEIRSGKSRGSAFREKWNSLLHSPVAHRKDLEEPGYDDADTLANRLLTSGEVPEVSQDPEPGMVYFQKTPARIVVALAERVAKYRNSEGHADALFIDLGSGLGQVSLLFHLLTGMRSCGIEIQGSYCDFSRACARHLGLADVDFSQVDLRDADMSLGTIFFMYSPVEGEWLQQVLERWCRDARAQARLFAYGPCNEFLLRHPGLEGERPQGDATYALCAFRKREART